MKIAAAQIQPIKGDILSNIEKHKILIDIAINNGTDLIIFPELSITGYEPGLAEQLSLHYEDPILNNFQNISDKNSISIWIGMPTKSEGKLFISCIMFHPKKRREIYSKRNLFPTEVEFFSKGNGFCHLEILQNKISLAICYDISDPTHSYEAYGAGSNIYIASVLNSINGIDDDLIKLSDIAKKYTMTVLMANFVGESGGYVCAGKTSVWNNDGNLIDQLDNKNEGIIILNTESNQVEKFYRI
ncbi:MAG: carbon-nitrogen hydrolase family protein [Chryseobacterium sp.]|jgi:predicted amidohydrolase|nr:carbon-nitrogen hydrolase family protein [Chryseobacterium sp.]